MAITYRAALAHVLKMLYDRKDYDAMKYIEKILDVKNPGTRRFQKIKIESLNCPDHDGPCSSITYE